MEYFRRESTVVGEAGLEPWLPPMGHIYYGPMQRSCLLGVSHSVDPRSLRTRHGKRDRRDKLITREKKMKLLAVCALMTVATGAPGLLRVPRVYNAVITSNQNLSPSRAFPVIQPVIHRTAVGYVPPFYYTQVAPHFAGPEVVHYLPGGGGGNAADGKPVAGRDQTQAPSASRLAESTSFGVAKEREDASGERADAGGGGTKDEAPARRKNEQLSFYPNYYSLYYEPYVYTYNSFNPHLVPGTYYVDYQPYGEPPLKPIPTSVPKNADSGRLLAGYHDERDRTKDEKKEKIPDVPPPPLPTSVPKNYAPEDAPDDRTRLRRERMRVPRAL